MAAAAPPQLSPSSSEIRIWEPNPASRREMSTRHATIFRNGEGGRSRENDGSCDISVSVHRCRCQVISLCIYIDANVNTKQPFYCLDTASTSTQMVVIVATSMVRMLATSLMIHWVDHSTRSWGYRSSYHSPCYRLSSGMTIIVVDQEGKLWKVDR
ncbi:hypothetical protein BHE74_00023618 [Ensete ventricosum]|nr:hypothetical protein BHE74_00023618 [Ensete ventricosum]